MADNHVLGLDLGTNSIGWCLLEINVDKKPVALVDGGVRIFQEAVEAKTRTPKNLQRRSARLTRRVLDRRARRKRKLRNFLISRGLLPEELHNTDKPEHVLNAIGDPYQLRKRALKEALHPHEVGRALLHLCARRGFQSNRKTALMDLFRSGDPDVLEALRDMDLIDENDEEETKFKAEISALQAKIDASGLETLGAYLSSLPRNARKRAKRTDRAMYEKEFNLIWERQVFFDPVRYSDVLRLAIHEVIFFQRPIKQKKDRRGKCTLEPSRPRAAMARLECQEFRYRQDINNLTLLNRSTGEYRELGAAEKAELAKVLEQQQTLSWGKIRTLLGFSRRDKFNLEESKVNALKGNTTAAKIQAIMSNQWNNMAEQERISLVEDLLTIKDRAALLKRLMDHWNFDKAIAIMLAVLEFEPGHSNHSLKVINALLPHMRNGRRYDQARVAAGYGYEEKSRKTCERLGEPPEARNPIVQKALYETRKLVNAVIREHGKPVAIRVEMARDLKNSKTGRAALDKQNKANKKENDAAADQYAIIRANYPALNLSEFPSQEDKLRYRLWKESEERCMYSGEGISMARLWSPEIEIDHILPYRRSLDDSYMNKVVCLATENRKKRDRTPFETWGNTERYEQIVQCARKFPIAKRKRIQQLNLDKVDDFISRQLNDTRYICRLTLSYLKTLGCDITITKGQMTALLRRHWRLNGLLGNTGKKNRADHRHHFVDAVVTALADRRVYQKVASAADQLSGGDGTPQTPGFCIPEPMTQLRPRIDTLLSNMLVSHATVRKLTGAFHEDTAYSVYADGTVARRKAVDASFRKKDVDDVIDPAIRKELQRVLAANNSDSKQAFGNSVILDNGHRLRHVRLRTAKQLDPESYLTVVDNNKNPIKYLKYGNNHHVEVLRGPEGKIKTKFVNTMMAAQRARQFAQPVVNRDHGDEFEFLFALHINDMVTLDSGQSSKLFRVQQLDATDNRLELRLHTASTLDNKNEQIRKTIPVLIDKFKMRKVEVDTLGRIRNV